MHLAAPHGVTVDELGITVQRFGVGMQSVDSILVALADVAYSAITSGRMYVKLIRRRLTGRYGDGVSGTPARRHAPVDEREVGTGLLLGIHQHGLPDPHVAHAPQESDERIPVQLGHPASQTAALHRVKQIDAIQVH